MPNNHDLIKVHTRNASKYSNTLIRSTIDGMILDIPPVKIHRSEYNFNDGTTIAKIAQHE